LGRTPLIKLSPKKTVEGFIGGVIASFFVCYIMSSYLCQYYFFACPQTHLHIAILEEMKCEIDPIYIA